MGIRQPSDVGTWSSLRAERVILLVVRGVLLSLAASLLAVGAATAQPGALVEFSLLPEAWQGAPDSLAHLLQEGEVRLYREGSFAPEIVEPAGSPVEIPFGTWVWVATAPGYVSVGTDTLHLPRGEGPTFRRRAVLPVVEACEVRLDGRAEDWRGVQRIDFVSLDRGSVYPHDPRSGLAVRVPAGSFVAYTLGPRGLSGLGGPFRCRPFLEENLSPLPLPPPGRHSFMVHLGLPQGAEPKTEDLQVSLGSEAGGVSTVAPSALSRAAGRLSLFFIDLPVTAGQVLRIRHPELRTLGVTLPAEDRAVQDIGLHRLKPRRDLAFSLEYRPLRPHRQQRMRLFHCGLERLSLEELASASCMEMPQEAELIPGISTYRLQGLDDGQYLLVAEIDDEWVLHLGNGYTPYLDPRDDEPAQDPGLLPLRECEIYGHLLVDGEPVAGEVRLEPLDPKRPVRRFPTDEHLEYHLDYFGERPGELDLERLFPEARSTDLDGLYGLYSRPRLRACSADGACRSYHVFSTLVGEGRLDLELGTAAVLEVQVRAEESGRPLEGAHVLVSVRPSEIHFVHGEVVDKSLSGMEGQSSYTASDGRVRFRNLPAGEDLPLRVRKEGFQEHRSRVRMDPADREQTVEVRLRRESDEGLLLELTDGRPLARAFVLPLRGEERDWRCSTATSSLGRFQLAEPCRSADRYLILHPEAEITILTPQELFAVEATRVEPSPAPPVAVHFVDGQGQGLPNLMPALRYRTFELTPKDLSGAATLSHQAPLFFMTDERGLLPLRGVDVEAFDVPEVVLEWHGEEVVVPLAGRRPGEVVEVVLP